MDATLFDSISKLLASRKNRRAAIGGGLGLAAAAAGGRALAQDATPPATPVEGAHPDAVETITELFTQAFEAGTWEPGDTADTYTLTLTGVAAQTIYFSDRPERFFGLTPMDQYIKTLNSEPTDPPNAALITQGGDEIETLLVELSNPQYDASASTLTYDATLLMDYQQGTLASAAIDQKDFDFPASFDQGGLFIDGWCVKHDIACYHKDTNVHVGDTVVGTCWDWKHAICDPCHHERRDCAEAFPDPCAQHPNGWWPCYGDDEGRA